MPIPPLPTPYVRPATYHLDDEPTFTAPVPAVYTAANQEWVVNSVLTIHDGQLDAVATAIEKLYQQDFAAPLEASSYDIDPKIDTDGVTVLNAGFSIAIQQTNDAPSGFNVGPWTCSVGMAWSLRTFIRDTLNVGTPYIP